MSVPANLQLLIWDLDGTLIDSSADLVASVNAMLVQTGRTPLPEVEVMRCVGDGAAVLVQRALGLATPVSDPAAAELARWGLDVFLDHYGKHKLDHTRLYPGVAEGLAELSGAGYQMAVLTNKPVGPSREILEHLGVSGRFCAVYGGDSFNRKKPDPHGIGAVRAQCGVDATATVMIGDSAVDVRTGRAAGAWTCGLTYGFAPESLALVPPDWTADSFFHLTSQLLAARPPA